ncbi:MAG: collagen-like protein, partial [Pseudomonadaceae bacterium]|nr:collagen-like protein [Pseudomonadaceae bacterium]
MRNLCWLALLSCSWAVADTQVKVEANTLLRLPASGTTLVLKRLEVAEHATLLLPANLNELQVAELLLGRDAHIGIAPSTQGFRLVVLQGELAAGSHISTRGAAGSSKKPALAGRDLNLRLENVRLSDLTVDLRGGAGAAGQHGLDGLAGEAGGCLWGQASDGENGQLAGNGQSGAAGGQLRLEVPTDFDPQALKFNLQGGAGGVAGIAGQGGRGGAVNNCLLYDAAGGSAGQAGAAGKAGSPGPDGSFKRVALM